MEFFVFRWTSRCKRRALETCENYARCSSYMYSVRTEIELEDQDARSSVQKLASDASASALDIDGRGRAKDALAPCHASAVHDRAIIQQGWGAAKLNFFFTGSPATRALHGVRAWCCKNAKRCKK